MDEIVKVFKQFFYRDIMFIFGGLVFLSSFLYSIDRNLIPKLFNLNLLSSISVLVLCYSIGFLLQELCNLFHIININTYFEPCGYSRFIYRLFTRDKWENIDKEHFSSIKLLHRIDKNIHHRTHGRFERIVSLKQVCNVCGSSFLFSFFPLIASTNNSNSKYALLISITLFIFSFLFINISWVKGMQQMQWMVALETEFSNNISP